MTFHLIGDEVHEGEWIDVRWQCHRGHFLAGDSIHSEDHWDPINTYYGISTEVWAECKRCGRVDNPRLVKVGRRTL